MVGVAATEVNASWSKEEIIKAQQDDPSIFLVVQKLRCTNTAPKEDEDGWNDNGERRRYKQLWPQMEMRNGILHRRVDKHTPTERLVWVVPRRMRPDILYRVAKAFVDEVVTRHGVPRKILTDQGRNFEAELMRQVFHLLGVEKLRTSPCHPQTVGQVERLNRTLKGILAAYVNKDHTDWDVHLPLALFAYRNSVHSSSGVSPFRAVYGREANTPLVLMGIQTEAKEQFIWNYCDMMS